MVPWGASNSIFSDTPGSSSSSYSSSTVNPFFIMLLTSSHRSCVILFSKISFSKCKIVQRRVESLRGKRRPECFGKIELAVRRLPKEKTREASFSGCSDNEIGIRNTRSVELRRNVGFGDFFRSTGLLEKFLDGVGNLSPAAVIEGNEKRSVRALFARSLGFPHCGHEGIIDTIGCPDEFEANSVFPKFLLLFLEHPRKQRHQIADFFLGSVPILARKRVQCNVLDPGIKSVPCNLNGASIPPSMALKRGFPLFARPAAVPVHDNADVLRNLNFAWHSVNNSVSCEIRKLLLPVRSIPLMLRLNDTYLEFGRRFLPRSASGC